jgi:CRP/FNR family transcriptional regulator
MGQANVKRPSDNDHLPRQTRPRVAATEAWKEATHLLESVVYPKGFELFRQDCPAQVVYFSENGLVKLMRLEENGRELILSLKFSGSLLGAAAAIHNKPHPFSAVTVTRCKLARLSARKFLELVAADTKLASCLHEILSAELFDQTARLSQIACLPARCRLEQLLWQLTADRNIDENTHDLKFQLPLRHWEVAQLLAITPPYLSRLLAEMEQEEVISRTKGWITVRQPAGLWHALDSSS